MPSAMNILQSPPVGIGWRHPHFRELLERKPDLDFLEVHSENFFARGGAALAVLDRGRADYPVSLHGVGLSLGSATGLDAWHLKELASLVERVDPIRVSDHAAFARGVWGGRTVHAADLLPIPWTLDSLNVMCRHVDKVQEHLKRKFMVENLSAYLQWAEPESELAMQEVEFFNALAQRTGCLLLVDINNLYVNARNAQIAGDPDDPVAMCKRWLDQVNPAAVGEIHLAGHLHVRDTSGEIVIDDHGSAVCDAVWSLYRHALHVLGPVPTLLEWDTDVPALDVLLEEVAKVREIGAHCLNTEVPAAAQVVELQ
jgi:uncharacterized protein